MTKEEMVSLKKYKRDAVRISKQLGYDDSVREAILASSSESQISRIMHEARNN